MPIDIDTQTLADRLRERIEAQIERGGDMLYHGQPDPLDVALLARITALEAQVAGADARVKVERERCAQIAAGLDNWADENVAFALNKQICCGGQDCGGQDCGCGGATVGSYIAWHLADVIREGTGL